MGDTTPIPAAAAVPAVAAAPADYESQIAILKAEVAALKVNSVAAPTAAAPAADAPAAVGSNVNKPKGKNTKKQKYIPKVPKGMKDYKPEDMAVREKVFDVIRRVFKRHGAVAIETPVMELRETLVGKYGEDSKLIYDLADQGGEMLSLRYDLTVPFARFCAMYNVSQIKRYHIARVYRRDRPVMEKGRFREFYQCDFDIAGEHKFMLADAECVKIGTEVLDALDVGKYEFKLNHRQLLDGIFAVCGVPEEKLRTICSAVDKLDKAPWEEVKTEMIEKGLDSETADRIWGYVQRKGGLDVVDVLEKDELLMANESAAAGLKAIRALFEACSDFNVTMANVSFDLSLARGLDYYTGVIYEAVLVDAAVGSVLGGGRYDNLVGMFAKKNRSIPCVGISFGIERLFTVVEQRQKDGFRASPTDVLVVSGQKTMERQRYQVCASLWDADVSAETVFKTNAKLMTQFQNAEKNGIPLMVIVGESEYESGTVKLRDTVSRVEEEIPIASIVDVVKQKLNELNSASASSSEAVAAVDGAAAAVAE